MTMASKPKSSLRRKCKAPKEEDVIEIDDDAFDELKSPKRKSNETGQNVFSPRYRSPLTTPTSSKAKSQHDVEDASFDEDKLSQEPTPSKWNCLLPDYYSSQSDGVACEVLWDCASPDAIKHLKRRQKGDKSIKEILKHFKEGDPAEGRIKSPTMQLHMLRASLQRQQEQQPPNTDRRKQRRLVQKRKKIKESNEQVQHLFGKILSAVEKRQELEAQQECAEPQQSGSGAGEASAVVSEAGQRSDDDDKEEEDDCWEDDDLFQDNSLILSATQNPGHAHLPQDLSGAARSSTPTLRPSHSHSQDSLHSSPGSSMLDTQNSSVIPPTCLPSAAAGRLFRAGANFTSGVKPVGSNLASGANKPAGQARGLRSTGQSSTAARDLPESHGSVAAAKEVTVAAQEGGVAAKEGSVAAKGGSVAAKEGSVAAKGGSVAAKGGSVAAEGGSVAAKGGSVAIKDRLRLAASSPATLRASFDSPKSRFEFQRRRKAGMTPKRLLHSAPEGSTSTADSQRLPPGAQHERAVRSPACLQHKHFNGAQGDGSAAASAAAAKAGTFLHKSAASSSTVRPQDDGRVDQPSTSSSSVAPPSGGRDARTLCAVGKVGVDGCGDVDGSKTSAGGVGQRKYYPRDKRPLRSSTKSPLLKKPALHDAATVSDALSDNGLSDELLLKLTESDSVFESQAIQLFPTQTPARLSAPVTLLSAKPAQLCDNDFADDLDPDILASICEYDSFSESPRVVKKDHSGSGQLCDRQQPSVLAKPSVLPSTDAAVSSTTVGLGGKEGHKAHSTFYPAVSVKPGTRSSTGKNYRSGSSSATLGLGSNAAFSKTPQNYGQETANTHLVYPPFAQDTVKPLGSRAHGNSISEKMSLSQASKKFVFKPVTAAVRASGLAVPVVPSAVNGGPQPSKDSNNAGGGHGLVKEDSDEDMLADNALYESQIIELLDAVESQVSQRSTSLPPAASSSPEAHPQCSQEQIERKRQAALQRKLRLKTKTK